MKCDRTTAVRENNFRDIILAIFRIAVACKFVDTYIMCRIAVHRGDILADGGRQIRQE